MELLGFLPNQARWMCAEDPLPKEEYWELTLDLPVVSANSAGHALKHTDWIIHWTTMLGFFRTYFKD